jgi:hypothetical protein
MDVTNRQPNIARAIQRSRAARERQRSRRRRRSGLAAAVAVLLGSGTLFTITAATGGDPVFAAISKAASLADLLAQRSPGERTEAMLTKMKASQRALARTRASHAPANAEAPSPAALAKILLPAETAVPVDLAAPVPLAQLAPPALATFVAPGGGGGPSISTPGGGSLPGGGGGSPPGGGSTPIVTPPTDDLVPTPAVPEPATWAMMLLGFGLIGWRVRRSAGRSPIASALSA